MQATSKVDEVCHDHTGNTVFFHLWESPRKKSDATLGRSTASKKLSPGTDFTKALAKYFYLMLNRSVMHKDEQLYLRRGAGFLTSTSKVE